MSEAEALTRIRLGLGDHGLEVGEEDYLHAEFDEPYRYELVDGRLLVMSPNSEEHDDTADPWRDAFYEYRRTRRGIIQKIVPEAWVRITKKRYRIGDLGVYLFGERSAQTRPIRAPEIMIEILSFGGDSHDRDLVKKRSDYHSISVLEYLVVDREEGRVIALTHGPRAYDERILTAADTYTTPLLPGLAIPLAEIL